MEIRTWYHKVQVRIPEFPHFQDNFENFQHRSGYTDITGSPLNLLSLISHNCTHDTMTNITLTLAKEQSEHQD